MSKIASREIRLVSRPTGIPTAANFAMAGIELAPPQDQQVLVRSLYVSVDPYRFVADGRWTGIPGHASAWPILTAASIPFSNCHWKSERLFYDHETHPPDFRGNVVGRLPSNRLSIAKGRASVREHRDASDAKQLLQLAPSTPG